MISDNSSMFNLTSDPGHCRDFEAFKIKYSASDTFLFFQHLYLYIFFVNVLEHLLYVFPASSFSVQYPHINLIPVSPFAGLVVVFHRNWVIFPLLWV